jgi:MFS family permease
MQINSPISDIARVIQLSIAPVFLITGIAGLLSVLSGRLGRTIDRSRVLHALPDNDDIDEQLSVLSRRAKLIYRAITLGTTSALLICLVIVSLFISAFVTFPIGRVIAVLFVAAIIALIAALVLFLREVFLATRALRIQPR